MVVSVGVGMIASGSVDVDAGEIRSTPLMHAGKIILESPTILLLPASGVSKL
jgi:hypothetical protein